MPGALLVGDAAGLVDTVSLKGVHHAVLSGKLAGEAIYDAVSRGETSLAPYEDAIEDSQTGRELYEVRNARQPFQKGFIKGGPLVNLSIVTKGKFPGGRLAWHRNDETADVHRQDEGPLPQAGRQVHLRQALQRLHHRQPDPRRRAEPHPRAEAGAARGGRDLGVDVPRRRLRDPRRGRPRPGDVDVIVNYTNCVQCGAITAKGGRLTTPEGGDGPLYQLT